MSEPLDDEFVGRTGEPFPFTVEAGKVREFARATKSRNDAYASGAVSPATFLMAMEHWKSRVHSPWGDHPPNPARLLHAEQEFTFHGPPPAAGTELVVQGRIDKRYRKEGKRGGSLIFSEVVWAFRTPSGSPVADVRFTLVETSKATA